MERTREDLGEEVVSLREQLFKTNERMDKIMLIGVVLGYVVRGAS